MAFTTLINADKQIRQKTVGLGLLAQAVQDEINQVAVNKADIAAIKASKGAANGIATLGSDSKLSPSQIPSVAISDFLGEVATVAGLITLVGERGDWATVVPTDPTQSQSYMLIGDDATVAANWKEIRTPMDGVSSVRNTSGTVSGLNGVVTLSDVAFSGLASDLGFTDGSYTATNVAGALVEVMGKVTTAESDIDAIQTALQDVPTNAKTKKAVALTGTIDGTNKVFSIPEAFVTGTLEVFFNGVYKRLALDYTVSGTTVTLNASPDYEDERPFVNYIAA